jgi:CheY-like chemotaxis protein
VLERILVESGYRVDVACTASEALRLLEVHGGRVDLVLSDVVMPQGMSGGDLAMALRASYPQVKILLTSGYSPDVVRSRAVVDMGVRFLQKPYSAQQLLSEVRAVLDQPSVGRISPIPQPVLPTR